MTKFEDQSGDKDIECITPDDILTFLTEQCEGQKQSTKRFKYTLLKSFFNFTINSARLDIINPCDAPVLRKSFRIAKGRTWTILEKDLVDEIIFKTEKPRNRLMLELMARGGMCIGEVLKLRTMDVDERNLLIKNPKSGRQTEVVYIPQKVADRLQKYISDNGIEPDDRTFPITYAAARIVVKKAGELVGIHLKPHDLRRHAATYASRSGTPLEIVSKVLLRHSNLSITQRYLGKISDVEAMRWIDKLHG